MTRKLIVLLAAFMVSVGVGLATGAASSSAFYDEFGCGIGGLDISPGEHCPVAPDRHRWSQVTAYRNPIPGIFDATMCEAVYRDFDEAELSRRCTTHSDSISAIAGELQDGQYLSRSYNVNSNQFVGKTYHAYLYSRTP